LPRDDFTATVRCLAPAAAAAAARGSSVHYGLRWWPGFVGVFARAVEFRCVPFHCQQLINAHTGAVLGLVQRRYLDSLPGRYGELCKMTTLHGAGMEWDKVDVALISRLLGWSAVTG